MTEVGSSAQEQISVSPKSTEPHAFTELQSVSAYPQGQAGLSLHRRTGQCSPPEGTSTSTAGPTNPRRDAPTRGPHQEGFPLPGQGRPQRLNTGGVSGEGGGGGVRGAYGDPGRDGGGVGESTAPGPDRRLQHHGQSPRRRCGIGAQGRFRAPLRAPTLPHPLPTQGGVCVWGGGVPPPQPTPRLPGSGSNAEGGDGRGGGGPQPLPPHTHTPRRWGREAGRGGRDKAPGVPHSVRFHSRLFCCGAGREGVGWGGCLCVRLCFQ